MLYLKSEHKYVFEVKNIFTERKFREITFSTISVSIRPSQNDYFYILGIMMASHIMEFDSGLSNMLEAEEFMII